jgi:hypothetical protein
MYKYFLKVVILFLVVTYTWSEAASSVDSHEATEDTYCAVTLPSF